MQQPDPTDRVRGSQRVCDLTRRAGICQIYLAEVPDELREHIRTGQLSIKERLLF